MDKERKLNADVWFALRIGIDRIDYSYDDNGNVSTEKLYRKGDLLMTITYEYDAQNRVTSVVKT